MRPLMERVLLRQEILGGLISPVRVGRIRAYPGNRNRLRGRESEPNNPFRSGGNQGLKVEADGSWVSCLPTALHARVLSILRYRQ